ncbi:unnamed protein product [Parnassius apollo]|uniref:(apollo) hypothetical protein n=1 Tax=Parnassius apollo TaxID=110799 RepID=A0A8S3XYL4_PARAO|nr:unnamed protein product [Parnassius apollo]
MNWSQEQILLLLELLQGETSTPVPILILDDSTEAPAGSQGQYGQYRWSDQSLLKITLAEDCPCSKMKQLPMNKEQSKVTCFGEGKPEKQSEDCDVTHNVRKEGKPEKQSEDCDVTHNESIGVSSIAESAISDPLSTTECLKSKLFATMQILENKEETIRVQAQSLAVAEERISAMAERADMLRRQLSQTVKQEELIDLLRKSFLDIRIKEREKTEKIGCLQNVVNSQKLSLDRCQDIALEVENLKSEISNFLNNSNNDSGMWEREESLTGELGGELQHISGQLLRLRELLAGDCTCGLRDENVKLKKMNEDLVIQVKDLRQRVHDLEVAVADKDKVNLQYQRQLELKEEEFRRMAQQLSAFEESSKNQNMTCESMNRQLQQLQIQETDLQLSGIVALLKDKSDELAGLRKQCEVRESTAAELQRRLDDAQLIIAEERGVRSEVRELGEQVCRWREQLQQLQHQLQTARAHSECVTQQYREEAHSTARLRDELAEARRRGALLCARARRLALHLRAGLTRQRLRLREQEEKIQTQEELIRRLQQPSDMRQNSTCDNEPCCSRYISREKTKRRNDCATSISSEVADCLKCTQMNRKIRDDTGSQIGSCSEYRHMVRERASELELTSESDINNCSVPPKPPRRLLRKKKPSSNTYDVQLMILIAEEYYLKKKLVRKLLALAPLARRPESSLKFLHFPQSEHPQTFFRINVMYRLQE